MIKMKWQIYSNIVTMVLFSVDKTECAQTHEAFCGPNNARKGALYPYVYTQIFQRNSVPYLFPIESGKFTLTSFSVQSRKF